MRLYSSWVPFFYCILPACRRLRPRSRVPYTPPSRSLSTSCKLTDHLFNYTSSSSSNKPSRWSDVSAVPVPLSSLNNAGPARPIERQVVLQHSDRTNGASTNQGPVAGMALSGSGHVTPHHFVSTPQLSGLTMSLARSPFPPIVLSWQLMIVLP